MSKKIEIETDNILVERLGYSIQIRGAGNLKINGAIIESKIETWNSETLIFSTNIENKKYKITIEELNDVSKGTT